MSPLELLAPEAAEAIPFSVRLAARRLAARAETTRSDRRAHERRSAADLEWLQAVRLTGGTGYDVRLVDLSEGGALLEVDAPLRPGVILTLELSGPGLDTAVPMEVLRCYIANLRGETATYRGACAFTHLIELPGKDARPLPAAAAANFVGTDAALKYLLDRCTSPGAPGRDRHHARAQRSPPCARRASRAHGGARRAIRSAATRRISWPQFFPRSAAERREKS